MPVWVKALIVILALITISLLLAVTGFLRTRRHLRALFAGRNAEASFASCISAFEGFDLRRVQLAYRWVQELVDIPNAPLRASDNLWTDLHIDQGNADDMFESAHDWKGEQAQKPAAPFSKPVETVVDLMSEILAYRYEGYADVVRKR